MSTRRNPAKKTAPKPNISELGRKYDVSRETIRKIRENGTDLADEAAVTSAIAASKARLSAPVATTDGESYSEARRRRAIADANLAELRAQRESKTLIDRASVEAVFLQIVVEFRARLLSLRGDLIHQLHGLNEAGIYKVLDQNFCDLLTAIAERKPIPE